ncbi:aminopeptidase P family protein [candidate division WOR-3 bacterium]|nr:aminopeptidase P family protein [candidate division WOR-3 bacterium]
MVTPLDRLRAKMLERGWECCVLTKILDVYFLLKLENFVNFIETKATLVVFLDEIILISDSSTSEIFKGLSPVEFKFQNASWKESISTGGLFINEIARTLREKKITTAAIDNPLIKKDLKGIVTFRNLGSTISKIAIKKDGDQIVFIKKAYSAMNGAILSTIPSLKAGISEIETRNMLDLELHRLGAEKIGVPTMVNFSNGSCFPDPVPSARSLQEGDLVMYEISAGYKSEAPIVGRTAFFKPPDPERQKILERSLMAYRKMTEWIDVGKLSGKASDALSDALGELAEFQTNVAGFGLGASSDYFYITPVSNHVFRENEAVVTILSLNVPGLGIIRFSDTILISSGEKYLTPGDYPLILN